MDYAQLQTDIANLLNRNDLTVEIPGFIALCDAQINRDIRHWRMENRATLTTVNQYPALPLDWVETQRLTNTYDGTPLVLLSRQAMAEERRRTNDSLGSRGPQFFRHSQEGFELFPSPGEGGVTLELEYFAALPKLGVPPATGAPITETNWLLEEAPDVYLYGSAIHSAPFLADDARIQTWGNLYNIAAQRVNDSGKMAEMSTSSPQMRKRGMVQSRQWDGRK